MSQLMLAAGHVKTVVAIGRFAQSDALDEITAGSFTLLKRRGNDEPVFMETTPGSGSYLNAVGLKNGGLPYLEANLDAMVKAARTKRLRISIAPIERGDLVALVYFLSKYTGITLEVNTGCPNVWHDGVQKPLICHDVRAFAHSLAEVMNARGKLRVAVKLSPLPDDIRGEIIDLCYIHSVDEIVTMNTRPNVSTLNMNEKQLLSVPLGGLSGRAIQEEALEEVRKISKILLTTLSGAPIRLVGCGGIDSPLMVQRMEDAGADAVQIGSYAFVNGPKVFEELRVV